MDAPEVTVVIPTRDRPVMLTRALATVRRQRAVATEVIVVDDGSQPPAGVQLERLAAREGARVIRHPRPRGVAAARNAGVAQAASAWIAFLDDDDQWAPSKLRAQLDAAAKAEASFVYGPVAVTDGARVNYVDPAPNPSSLERDLLRWNVIPAGSSSVLVRAAALEQVGGWDERFAQMPDWDLWIRLAQAHTSTTITEVAVAYLTHRESMMSARDDLEREFDLLAAKHAASSRRVGVEFDRLRLARWIALGYRRRGRRARAALEYARVAARHRSGSDLTRAFACALGERVMRAGRPAAPLPPWFEPPGQG